MDYEKLTEESLDEIMRQIRAEIEAESGKKPRPVKSRTAAPVPAAFSVDFSVGDFAPADVLAAPSDGFGEFLPEMNRSIHEALANWNVGVDREPMTKKRGPVRAACKLVERLYLRVSELTNRHVREFHRATVNYIQYDYQEQSDHRKNIDALSRAVGRLTAAQAALAEEMGALAAGGPQPANVALPDVVSKLEDRIAEISREGKKINDALAALEHAAGKNGRELEGMRDSLRDAQARFRTVVAQTEDRLAATIANVNGRLSLLDDAFVREVKIQRGADEKLHAEMEDAYRRAFDEAEALGERISGVEARVGETEALRERISGVEARVGEAEALRERISGVEARADEAEALRERISGVEARVGEAEALRERIARAEARADETEAKIVGLTGQLNDTRLQLNGGMERIAAVGSIVKWANNRSFTQACAPDPEAGPSEDMSLFYHDFEERFRGTQEDIKDRLRVYLPHLLAQFGSLSGRRCVDLACGRGEWLELLREHGAGDIVGVDLNGIQVELCRGKGFDARREDLLAFLRAQPDASVDLISGFQVLEHLPMDVLLALFGECARVLKKGGLILFETPNVSNLQVGATWFYVDPTHDRPLHKEVARFIAERSGFQNVEIIEANPARYVKKLLEPACFDGNERLWAENIALLNGMLFGPQDYAVLGVKNENQ